MKEYHKIHTIFKRDLATNHKTLLEGQWSRPEFEFLADNTWEFTEKVDGTNIRVMFEANKITFGGKTDNAQIPAQLVDRLNTIFSSKIDVFSEIFGNSEVCLYGEGYGLKIQKGGGNYRLDQDFVLFDVKVGTWWLARKDVEDIAYKLGIDVVPVIGRGTLHTAISLAKKGIQSTWGNFQAEGIVARPTVELYSRNGDRIITKIKCRDFAGK